MKKIIVLLFVFCCVKMVGQSKSNIDSLITLVVKEKQMHHIRSFFFLKTTCVGSSYIVKKDTPACLEDNTEVYLFWKENERSYVQKIDNCGFYKPLNIKNAALNFFESNIDAVKQEKVQRYSIKKDSIAKDGKIWKSVKMVSHSCFVHFQIYDNEEISYQEFDVLDLTTEEKDKNRHYEFNNALFIVRLNEMCRKVVDSFELKERFGRL